MNMSLTSGQCRMARAAVGLTQSELARKANISTTTLTAFESGQRAPYDRTLRDVRTVFEELGITFLEPDERGAGVRYIND